MTQADGTVRCRSYATLGELLSSNVRQEALPDQASLGTRLAPIFLVNHRADGFGTEPAAGDCAGE